MSAPKLDPERSALVVIDVQEGFRKAIGAFDGIAAATATMIRGAEALEVPIHVTEQHPKGLGATVSPRLFASDFMTNLLPQIPAQL